MINVLQMKVSHSPLIQKSDLTSYTTVCSSTDSRFFPSQPVLSHSSRSAVGSASHLVIGISFVLVIFSLAEGMQISPNPLPSADALLRFRRPSN